MLITLSSSYELNIITPPVEGYAEITDGVISYLYDEVLSDNFLLDSFYVEVVDSNGMSDTAVYRVVIIPKETLEYLAVPNPMIINGNTVEPLPQQLLSDFNLSAYKYQYGSAILLRTQRKLLLTECEGTITIFDAVGNVIAREIDMTWLLTSNDYYSGVGVWNGRNENNRIVGSGSYLAVIKAVIHYEEFNNNNLEYRTKEVAYRVMIGIKHE